MSWYRSNKPNFNWIYLQSDFDLKNAVKASFESPVLIFKHSTRCSISTLAKNRIETGKRVFQNIYFLDLLKYRSISNEIASQFNVIHQSPQILMIVNGECVYNASHQDVRWENIPTLE